MGIYARNLHIIQLETMRVLNIEGGFLVKSLFGTEIYMSRREK